MLRDDDDASALPRRFRRPVQRICSLFDGHLVADSAANDCCRDGRIGLGQVDDRRRELPAALELPYVDGDSLHSAANIAKMHAGTPLTDADRAPWLDRIGACLADAIAAPLGMVIACSALKRDYRNRIRRASPGVRFVFLDGSAELIGSRMAHRSGHYMPTELLASQLQTLERPTADEADVLRVTVDRTPQAIVEQAADALRSLS